MNVKKHITLVLSGLFTAAWLTAQPMPAKAEDFITMASTTSTQNSGLLDYILPMFTKKTGVGVRVIAVGTGQAVRVSKNGDADVLLVHHRPSEDAFVAEGYGVRRYDVMYNDFIVIGPDDDPAGITATGSVEAAFRRIAQGRQKFVSRGDDSGTHKREQAIWKSANIDIKAASGEWYRETGSGMGATLNSANAMGAYALSDRSTWLAFANQRGMKILFEGMPALFNPYGVILVNPERHPHVKAKAGQAFIDWLVSSEGRKAISAYAIKGQQAFFPGAPPAQP